MLKIKKRYAKIVTRIQDTLIQFQNQLSNCTSVVEWKTRLKFFKISPEITWTAGFTKSQLVLETDVYLSITTHVPWSSTDRDFEKRAFLPDCIHRERVKRKTRFLRFSPPELRRSPQMGDIVPSLLSFPIIYFSSADLHETAATRPWHCLVTYPRPRRK